MQLSFDRNEPSIIWTARLAGLIVIIGAATAMMWLSWGKWPDVLVDFGRELYVPWMLGQGKVLYRDLLYFNGPLSPYWNAQWFGFFGPAISTLVWVNLALFFIMMLIIYRILSYAGSTFAVFVACLVFIFLFAFNQYDFGVGNFNYVCPYSHEATHGMVLSWMTLACLIAYTRSNRVGWLAGAGVASGLVFLTKPEFFVATSAASAMALALWIRLERPSTTRVQWSLTVFVAALIVPPIVAFVLLAMVLPWSEAGIGMLGGWWYLWDSQISSLKFYREGMGIDTPWINLGKMFMVAGEYAMVLVPAAVLAIVVQRKWTTIVLVVLEWAGVGALAWWLWRNPFWWELGRPLPLFMVIVGGWILWMLTRHPQEKYVAASILIAFSLGLMGKMLLNGRIHHYGFTLAMPAMLVMVLALLDWIPAAIKKRGGQSAIFYSAALAVLVVIVIWHVSLSKKNYSLKKFAVGRDSDAFIADIRGVPVNWAIDWLNRNAQPQDTLAVLPEGVMINYLARKPNSTPVINLMPPEILMFGEDHILQALQAAPPDYIMLVHKDTSEYGLRFFGQDYGQAIFRWILRNYYSVDLYGHPPLLDPDKPGILIAKRKERR
jgi:hypothetical protein